jgi:hypothetical protein
MKLENPLKLQRVAVVRPPRPAQQEGYQPRSRDGGPGARSGPPSRPSPAGSASRRPVGSIDGEGEIIRPVVGDGPADSRRLRRVPSAKEKPPTKEWKKSADDVGKKTSLRIGTGKKGRTAEINGRRGSLRRRDRSSQKAAKEEAAIERKTVYLPECVSL